MPAGAGIQPHVVWGQNSGACGHALLLAPALVPGHPGSGAGGHSVHHHHLHPEVMRFFSLKRTEVEAAAAWFTDEWVRETLWALSSSQTAVQSLTTQA